MDSLFLNFLKRAFLVPILVAALAAGAITVAVPVLAAHSTRIEAAEKTAEQSVDITKYTLHSYKNFKELAEGNLVGTIRCENISLGQKAIIYSKAEKSNIVLNKASVEPWKKGGVLLVGSNTSEQFKVLHNAKKGDVFTVSFYDNDEYRYKLKKQYNSVQEKDLTSYIAKDTLVLCVPYNDFTDLGNAFYYRVYVAELV